MAPLDWEDDDDDDEYQDASDIEVEAAFEEDVDYEGIAQDDAERRALEGDDDPAASDDDLGVLFHQDTPDTHGQDEGDHASFLQITLPQDQASVNTIRDILLCKSISSPHSSPSTIHLHAFQQPNLHNTPPASRTSSSSCRLPVHEPTGPGGPSPVTSQDKSTPQRPNLNQPESTSY